MRHRQAIVISAVLSLLVPSTTLAQNRDPGSRERGARGQTSRQMSSRVLNTTNLTVGEALPGLEGLEIYGHDGERTPFRSILVAPYTVIVSGCLTCPVYLRTYPGIEAVARDYEARGVDFYFMYQSLAHPENNGYIQPFTIEERLAQVEAAKITLGTSIPWLCDTMENEMKKALGGAPNSGFIFDAEGRIVHMEAWCDGSLLRSALVSIVGSTEEVTHEEDLRLPVIQGVRSPSRGVVPRVSIDELLLPIRVEPVMEEEPFYVKLRAEVTRDVLQSGTGQMYIGFHVDPIHHVHWNNLVAPVSWTLTGPGAASISPAIGRGPEVEVASDVDPREFLLEVNDWNRDQVLSLEVQYFACSDEEGWCKPVMLLYAIYPETKKFSGSVMGRTHRRGGSGRSMAGGRGSDQGRQRGGVPALSRFDRDDDGLISREEARGPMLERFDYVDRDGDGNISPEEMEFMMQRFRDRGTAPSGSRGRDVGQRNGPSGSDAGAALPALEGDSAAMHRFTGNVSASTMNDHVVIESTGIPTHETGEFPTRGNPNTISPQEYRYRISAVPEVAEEITPLGMSPFGVAVNGVPIDPGTAEYWNDDRGSGWRYEALSGHINLGLDASHAHVQRTGAYHYHGLPTGLLDLMSSGEGEGEHLVLLGYAADGFPIYAEGGAWDASARENSTMQYRSGYRVRDGDRPGGPGGQFDGTFVEDYEFVSGAGTLDECNGRFGSTPEHPDGTYHYILTHDFPFVPRFYRGTPDDSFTRRSHARDRSPEAGGRRSIPGGDRDRPPSSRQRPGSRGSG